MTQCDQVTTRVQFGNKLETYGVVQEKLARMAIQLYVTEVSGKNPEAVMFHGVSPASLPAVHCVHAQRQYGQRRDGVPA